MVLIDYTTACCWPARIYWNIGSNHRVQWTCQCQWAVRNWYVYVSTSRPIWNLVMYNSTQDQFIIRDATIAKVFKDIIQQDICFKV